LTAALEACRRDEKAKVVVVTGTGSAFCSGGDIAVWRRAMMSSIVKQNIARWGDPFLSMS
jgi:enoyl-CoA hydratase/carnithine racemase